MRFAFFCCIFIHPILFYAQNKSFEKKELITYLDEMEYVFKDSTQLKKKSLYLNLTDSMSKIIYYQNDTINLIQTNMQEDGGLFTSSKCYLFWNTKKSKVIELRIFEDECSERQIVKYANYLIIDNNEYLKILIDCDINIEQILIDKTQTKKDKADLKKRVKNYQKLFD